MRTLTEKAGRLHKLQQIISGRRQQRNMKCFRNLMPRGCHTLTRRQMRLEQENRVERWQS